MQSHAYQATQFNLFRPVTPPRGISVPGGGCLHTRSSPPPAHFHGCQTKTAQQRPHKSQMCPIKCPVSPSAGGLTHVVRNQSRRYHPRAAWIHPCNAGVLELLFDIANLVRVGNP
jgi:hypothetical protein